MTHGDSTLREEMEHDIKRWTRLPQRTLTPLPFRMIDLMHTACMSAMKHERERIRRARVRNAEHEDGVGSLHSR